MKKLKGLYIEDDPGNLIIYTEFFKQANLELMPVEFPMELSDYYSLVLENDIDFLVIDYHLDKQVSYKGTDVLREIRSHDSTIYAVLLTNYDWEDFKQELGEYDYELKKDMIRDKYLDVAEKIKRACMLRSERELEAVFEQATRRDHDTITLLREISKKLDEIE